MLAGAAAGVLSGAVAVWAHLIKARATRKTGCTQTATQSPPEPNGATGYPSVTVT